MRPIIALAFILICRAVVAQEIEVLNLGQAIGVAAERDYEALKARLTVLERLVPAYLPTYTWPGSNGPEPFESLRKHMAGENIHPERFVSKWSPAELAFVHDCDHIQELLDQGKGLPMLKDQRLRDWVRAKSPARALPRKLGWAIKRIVMHTQSNCPPCEQWKQTELPKAQADGVVVEFAGPDGRPTPAFDVELCSDDQCRMVRVGNMRYETMKKL